MKFTEHLAAHITPEWRKQYINYEVSFNFSHFQGGYFFYNASTYYRIWFLRIIIEFDYSVIVYLAFNMFFSP